MGCDTNDEVEGKGSTADDGSWMVCTGGHGIGPFRSSSTAACALPACSGRLLDAKIMRLSAVSVLGTWCTNATEKPRCCRWRARALSRRTRQRMPRSAASSGLMQSCWAISTSRGRLSAGFSRRGAIRDQSRASSSSPSVSPHTSRKNCWLPSKVVQLQLWWQHVTDTTPASWLPPKASLLLPPPPIPPSLGRSHAASAHRMASSRAPPHRWLHTTTTVSSGAAARNVSGSSMPMSAHSCCIAASVPSRARPIRRLFLSMRRNLDAMPLALSVRLSAPSPAPNSTIVMCAASASPLRLRASAIACRCASRRSSSESFPNGPEYS